MIIKEVKPFGNGAQILVPKEWSGKTALISLQNKTLQDIKKDLLNNIKQLDKVACILVIGSYARNENLPESDVDVVIFCTEKLEINLPAYHIILVNINRLKEEINLNPALFKSILDEGIIILNSDFLKNIKINNKDIKNYKKECYNAYSINKKLIKLDKKLNTISPSVIYSAILRLRALFILKNKYSFHKFREWTIRNNLNFDDLYNIYKLIRDNKYINDLYVNLNEVEKANEFLSDQLR